MARTGNKIPPSQTFYADERIYDPLQAFEQINQKPVEHYLATCGWHAEHYDTGLNGLILPCCPQRACVK